MKTVEKIIDSLLDAHPIQTADGWTSHDAARLAIDAVAAYRDSELATSDKADLIARVFDTPEFDRMVSVAKIASEISSAHQHGNRIVLRAGDLPDTEAVVHAALYGQRHDNIDYRLITLKAEYSVHGGYLRGVDFPRQPGPAAIQTMHREFAEARDQGESLQIVVNVHSTVTASDRALIGMLSELVQQLDAVTEEHVLYLSNHEMHDVIWVIHEPVMPAESPAGSSDSK